MSNVPEMNLINVTQLLNNNDIGTFTISYLKDLLGQATHKDYLKMEYC